MELNANLSIHGTPCGQNFNGEDTDAKYCESFYDGMQDVAKMIIEVVDTPSGSVCHYSYKVSKDVSDVKGRHGGYIALTLSIDQLCTRPKTIYDILRSIFGTSVIGTFITPVASGYRHLVGQYSDLSDDVDNMRNNCFKLLHNLIKGDKSVMMPIQSGVRKDIAKINPYDVTDEELLNAIKKYRRVEVSTEFSLSRDFELDSKIQAAVNEAKAAITAQYKNQIDALSKENNELKRSINGNDQIQTLQELNNKLEKLNQELENENSELKKLAPNPRIANNTRKLLLGFGAIALFIVIMCAIFSNWEQEAKSDRKIIAIYEKLCEKWFKKQDSIEEKPITSKPEFPYDQVRMDLQGKRLLQKGTDNILTIQTTNNNRKSILYDCTGHTIDLVVDEVPKSSGVTIEKYPQWNLKIPDTCSLNTVTISCIVDGREQKTIKGSVRNVK